MNIRFLLILLVLSSCGSTKKAIRDNLSALESDFQNHTGFVLYDPEANEYLIDFQGDKYFTPASNTKILTFFTALQVLPDSLPGLEYVERGDSLIFWGTGDPSLFYEDLPSSHVYDFLSQVQDTLYLARRNYDETAFGPGWSWADYMYPYSSERSDLPLYGNTFTMTRDSLTGFLSTPQPYFRKFIWLGDTLERDRMVRDVHTNKTTFYPGSISRNSSFTIPFIYSPSIAAALLSDTLKTPVVPIEFKVRPDDVVKTVYSIPRDSALQVMMQESDNFIAEQLLMLSAYHLSDTLSGEFAIEYAKDNFLKNIPHDLQWVDGSGLSRYNLFTPKSVVWVWNEIFKAYPTEKILPLLASGGGPGTLKNWYVANPPFIYGKTGTLRNNHIVSGVIFTKKGRMLLFSFMNNNYPTSATPVKRKMEEILRQIYENL